MQTINPKHGNPKHVNPKHGNPKHVNPKHSNHIVFMQRGVCLKNESVGG